jgi:hypothetical protein
MPTDVYPGFPQGTGSPYKTSVVTSRDSNLPLLPTSSALSRTFFLTVTMGQNYQSEYKIMSQGEATEE